MCMLWSKPWGLNRTKIKMLGLSSWSSVGLSIKGEARIHGRCTTYTSEGMPNYQHSEAPAPVLGDILQRGCNKRESQANQVRNAVERPLSVPESSSFECGVFESLAHAHEDYIERPGFDRVVLAHLTRDVWALGVVDGHGYSPLCADYIAESFPKCLQLLLQNDDGLDQHGEDCERRHCDALQRAFRLCSDEWNSSPHVKTSPHLMNSGAVALLGLVDASQNRIHLACAGDCRALVGTTDQHVPWRFVHQAHRTDNTKERLRVVQQGGRIRTVYGVPRVQGMLIPTRVFGDTALKTDFFGRHRCFLDPDPEISTVQSVRGENESADLKRCLVVATDGLWDGVSDMDVANLCRDHLRRGNTAGDVARALGTLAMQSTDDDVAVIALVW